MNEHQRQRFSEALRRLSHDTELLCGMAALVVDDADQVLRGFRQSIVNGDYDEAARSAHQLKGMLSTFETGYPVNELQEIIDAARDRDGETACRRFDAIAPELRELINELAELQMPD